MSLVAVLVWILSFGGGWLATVSAEHLQLLYLWSQGAFFILFIYTPFLPPCAPALRKKGSVASVVGADTLDPHLGNQIEKAQHDEMLVAWEVGNNGRVSPPASSCCVPPPPHAPSSLCAQPHALTTAWLVQRKLSQSEALKAGIYLLFPSSLPEKGCCLPSGPAGNFLCGSCWF